MTELAPMRPWCALRGTPRGPSPRVRWTPREKWARLVFVVYLSRADACDATAMLHARATARAAIR
jgi:hypothetical protein